MAAINMCLLKESQWSILGNQHIQNQQQHHKHAHVMLCFTNSSDDTKQDAATTTAHSKRII